MGVPLNCIEPWFNASRCLARPKSQSFVVKFYSTKKLCDFISRWTMSCSCKNAIELNTCLTIFFLSSLDKTFFFLCSKSYKDPPSINYVTMAKFGGTLQIPTNSTILGCLYLASMLISLLNSFKSYSSIFGLKFFFTATSKPLYVPLWMVLKPPWEIWGPTYKLLNLISKIDSESSWKESFPFDLFYFTDILSSCLWSYYTRFCYDLNLFSI